MSGNNRIEQVESELGSPFSQPINGLASMVHISDHEQNGSVGGQIGTWIAWQELANSRFQPHTIDEVIIDRHRSNMIGSQRLSGTFCKESGLMIFCGFGDATLFAVRFVPSFGHCVLLMLCRDSLTFTSSTKRKRKRAIQTTKSFDVLTNVAKTSVLAMKNG